jgi:hypothetical protein
MIVQKEKTDAQREGFIAAITERFGERADTRPARDLAELRFPYQQERIITIGQYQYKVTAEDEQLNEYDTMPAGTLVERYAAGRGGSSRRGGWCECSDRVAAFTSFQLRQIADIMDNPLEDYVEPAAEPQQVEA